MSTPAVRKGVTVDAPVDRAFKIFTESFGTWWPATHRVRSAKPSEAVLEPVAGGRWYERDADGGECDWGRVLSIDPPHRIELSWHLDASFQYDPDPGRASRVVVTFTDLGDGRTSVELEHGDLDRHGDRAGHVADAVSSEGGWPTVLAGYADLVAAG